MQISHVIPQLRTTDLAASIRSYTDLMGFTLDFRYEDFYAGIRAGSQLVHLKLVDAKDPSSTSISTRPTPGRRPPHSGAREFGY